MKYCSQEGEDEIEKLLNGGMQSTINAPQDVGAVVAICRYVSHTPTVTNVKLAPHVDINE